ncbi:MAG: transposase [Planctomycetes bacterium]|nr:transposase [Planctomycetota bacterium]
MNSPIAYLITFTTYGTWLHGDERGSVNKERNQFGQDFVSWNKTLNVSESAQLKNRPVKLGKDQRRISLESILDVCRFENWHAHAVHVRSNHIHIVVSGNQKPEEMMLKFKRYATRALRLVGKESAIKKYWTKHGSTKYIWDAEKLALAVNYVKNRQGRMMEFGKTEGDLERQRPECK